MKLLQTSIVPLVRLALLSFASFVPAMMASASVIYSYTGNNFDTFVDNNPPAGSYDAADRVTGSFELAVPLPLSQLLTDITASVQAYTFSDGRNTLTEANSSISDFRVRTDAGVITLWSIRVQTTFPSVVGETWEDIITFGLTTGSGDQGTFRVCVAPLCGFLDVPLDRALVVSSPGTWTSSTVPEPSSALLVTTGLIGFAIRRRLLCH